MGVRVGSLRVGLHCCGPALMGQTGGLGDGENWLHLKVEPSGLTAGWGGVMGGERWEEPRFLI